MVIPYNRGTTFAIDNSLISLAWDDTEKCSGGKPLKVYWKDDSIEGVVIVDKTFGGTTFGTQQSFTTIVQPASQADKFMTEQTLKRKFNVQIDSTVPCYQGWFKSFEFSFKVLRIIAAASETFNFKTDAIPFVPFEIDATKKFTTNMDSNPV